MPHLYVVQEDKFNVQSLQITDNVITDIKWIVKHTDKKEDCEHWLPTTYQDKNCY